MRFCVDKGDTSVVIFKKDGAITRGYRCDREEQLDKECEGMPISIMMNTVPLCSYLNTAEGQCAGYGHR
jgi:hypothetical protein